MTFQELEKILLLDKPSTVLRSKKKEIAQLLPELGLTYDFDQKSIWHDKDVFEHTLMVVDGVEKDLRLRLAALFHDIGKPQSMIIDDSGEGHFHGHWKVSEEIFQKYQNCFSLSEEDIYFIRKLIFYHDLSLKSHHFDTFLCSFDQEEFELLYSLKKADAVAHHPNYISKNLKELEMSKEKILSLYHLLPVHDNLEEDYEFFNHEDQVDEEKIFLLAALCNSHSIFSYKKRFDNDSIFMVGVQAPNGYYYQNVPYSYWDFFDIPELRSSFSSVVEDSNLEHLKSLSLKKSI